MITYSVIIPYRDTYELLLKAVDSIPDRKDIQVIIIDNSLVPLLEEAVPKKNQASVLFLTSDPNAGAGHARNVGLSSACGRYVLFLDADDYFTEQAFSHFDRYIEKGFEIVFFSADSIKLTDGLPSKRHLMLDSLVKEYVNSGKEEPLRYLFENPYCKLYSLSFLREHNLRFEEVVCSNDTMFSIMSGHLATRIYAEDYPVYVITESSSGNSLTSRSKAKDFVRFTVSIRRNQYLQSVGKIQYARRLMPSLIKSFLYYGINEGIRYIKYAKQSKANLFIGYLK